MADGGGRGRDQGGRCFRSENSGETGETLQFRHVRYVEKMLIILIKAGFSR